MRQNSYMIICDQRQVRLKVYSNIAMLDGAKYDKDNINVFHEKYNKLYTSVPYNMDDMCDIKSQINNDCKILVM